MRGPVVVVGSLNMDLSLRVARAPAAGETLTARALSTSPGGKGLNQAVACARLGVPTAMVGMLGRDAFGEALRTALAKDGVDAAHVGAAADAATGIAMILVDDAAENRIVVASGANAAMTPARVEAAGALIDGAALVVLQLEIPMPAVEAAAARAAASGVPVLLNAAPALAAPEALLRLVDCVVVNQTEAAALTGEPVSDAESALRAARRLREMGARMAAVTLGAAGLVLDDGRTARHLPAVPARAVDTTGAGDAFVGGMAAGLAERMEPADAARLGIAAASVCVTRAGASAAMPTRAELAGLLARRV